MIESAGRGPGPAGDLLKTDGDSIKTETLVDMGRRALAIECSHFLRNANLDAERWLPYRIWGGQLDQQHTILTFNYDRIPELLESAKTTNRLPGAKLTVIDPERLDEGHVGMVQRMGSAPVLKLHGSVDWIVSNGRIKIDLADDLPTSCSKGTDLVLAVPGPAKASLRDEHKGIGRLWNAAKKAIRTANRIIFVGYRFPPTDAEARFELLGAVEDAREGSHLKKVQVVLGPNEHDPDVARMKKLLGFVSPGIVEVIPLLAEDFLALPAAYR